MYLLICANGARMQPVKEEPSLQETGDKARHTMRTHYHNSRLDGGWEVFNIIYKFIFSQFNQIIMFYFQ